MESTNNRSEILFMTYADVSEKVTVVRHHRRRRQTSVVQHEALRDRFVTLFAQGSIPFAIVDS